MNENRVTADKSITKSYCVFIIDDWSHMAGDFLMWTISCNDRHPCLTLHPLANIDIYPDNIRPPRVIGQCWYLHDGVMKWKYFPHYIWGNPPVTDGFPWRRPVIWTSDDVFVVSLGRLLTNSGVVRNLRSNYVHVHVHFGRNTNDLFRDS